MTDPRSTDATTGTLESATLVAELNDLLQLDHDGVQAYSIAISRLQNPVYKQMVTQFRGDHERHITELTRLIRSHGGVPIELPHLPTGVFKLAVQGIGALGGDRALLLAFKANERQGRDKYARAAERAPAGEIATVLAANASDEARHYAWALEVLEDLGVGEDTVVGRAERAFEVGHARMADVVEAVETKGMVAAEGARRGIVKQARAHPMRTVLMAVGVGLLAGALTNRGHWR